MIAKRLQKELLELQEDKLPNIEAKPSKKDISHWTAYLTGPQNSPYEGGRFKIDIKFPDKYPFKAPKLVFKTKVFHPNISTTGSICLDILQSKWSPALSISKVLLSLSSLLTDPNPDDPLRSEAARLFTDDRDAYDAEVRKYVQKYCLKLKNTQESNNEEKKEKKEKKEEEEEDESEDESEDERENEDDEEDESESD